MNILTIKHPVSKGFTLIELLISMGIIALLTGVVVFNQSDFSDQLALSNLTNEIDIQIREAQTYGISRSAYEGAATRTFHVVARKASQALSCSRFSDD